MNGNALLVYIIFVLLGMVMCFPDYDVDCNCKKEQVVSKKGMCCGACICVTFSYILYAGWNQGYAI